MENDPSLPSKNNDKEMQHIAESYGSQLTNLLQSLSKKVTLWHLSDDLSSFNHLLECAVKAYSITHFQQVMRILHANIKPTVWRDQVASVEWLKRVNNLHHLQDLPGHIALLRQNINFEAEEEVTNSQQSETTTCSSGFCTCTSSQENNSSQAANWDNLNGFALSFVCFCKISCRQEDFYCCDPV